MIALFMASIVVALAIYALLFRLGRKVRVIAALLVFILLVGSMVTLIAFVGDPPPATPVYKGLR